MADGWKRLTADKIIIAPYLKPRPSKNFKKIFSGHLHLKRLQHQCAKRQNIWKQPNTKIEGGNFGCENFFVLHSESKLESRGTSVGYKITPAEVRKRPTLPGLFRLPTLCGIFFLNSPDCPSFHNTIWTFSIMSSSIHLSDCSKCSLSFTISRFSTVIDYSSNLFQTSSSHERFYSELLSDFVNIRASPTAGLLW